MNNEKETENYVYRFYKAIKLNKHFLFISLNKGKIKDVLRNAFQCTLVEL